MGKYMLNDAYISVNSVVLDDHAMSVGLSINNAELDTTAMGDTWETAIGGMKSWSLSVEFQQDFANSNVDATISAMLGTVVAIEVRPTSDAVGGTNPKWTGNILVSGDYTPVGGSQGDLATVSVTWKGTGALTRATS